MKKIDYDKVRHNIDEMINVLEYDGSRSAGKIKINAQTLHYLLALKVYYGNCCPDKKPEKKQTPNKEG